MTCGASGAGVSACARVTRLSVTPVKGLALHHPDEIVLLRTGAVGDREFFVIDGCDTEGIVRVGDALSVRPAASRNRL